MAHPKHNHKHQSKESPKKALLRPMLLVAAVLGAWALWAIITSPQWKHSTPAPSPCCKPAPAPAPVVENPNLNHIIVAHAWCDHMPVWKESPERRHIQVSARPEVMIQSMEIRHNDKVIGSYIRLGSQKSEDDAGWVHLHGVFAEGMHGKDLAITVTYLVKGVKYQTILHCSIGLTN